jgi:hypothetical protein
MTYPRRARMAACVAGSCVLSACLPGAADAAVDQEIVRLDALRPTPVVLAGGAKPATLPMRFDLPAGAAQGPDRWYVVRLRYRLRFAPGSGRGLAWVTSDTNGRTAAQIEYTTSRRGGHLEVRRTTVDLTHGQRERRSRSPRDALTFTNYLQYAGIRPGPNTWTIRLEQAGAARVERMELMGDTAIVATDRTPFPLALTVALQGPRPRVGERFTLRATLAARRGQPVDDVVVRARLPEGTGLELLGSAARRVGRVDGRRRTVRFSFRARRAGNQAITLVAASDANHPNAGVEVEVLPTTRSVIAPARVWALTSIPALAMAAWLVVSRRRRRYAR